MTETTRKWTLRVLILSLLALLAADLAYKTAKGISVLNRDQCILSRTLPKWGFLLYEYFVELFLMVLAGVFLAALLERGFARFGRFYPRSPLTAFLWAAALPVCSCGVLPLLGALKGKIPLRTLVTFVVAAPVLSPFTIALSFTVLGPAYGTARIAATFVMAILTGVVVERFHREEAPAGADPLPACEGGCAPAAPTDPFERTYRVMRGVFPYFLVAGAVGVLLELAGPTRLLLTRRFARGWTGLLLAVALGIPLYLCNGAEILLLRPFTHQGGVPLGTAIAFSLSATSVCVTSIALLPRFLGRRSTVVLVACVAVLVLAMGAALNLLFPRLPAAGSV